MQKARVVVSRCSRALGWFVTITLLSLAVVISLARYALPVLDQHKSWVEQQLSAQLEVALNIGRIEAQWLPSGPSLLIRDIRIGQAQGDELAIELETLALDIDLWQSLLGRTLAARRFELIAPTFFIDVDNLAQPSGQDSNLVELVQHLFLSQLQHFSLTQGELVLRKGDTEQRVQLNSLLWFNEGEHHQGRGALQIDAITDNQLNFIIDLTGDLYQFNGLFFLAGQDIDVSPWLHQYLHTAKPLQKSRANFSAWVEFDEIAVEGIYAHLGESSITWGSDPENEIELAASAHFQAIPIGNVWSLRVDDLRLAANGTEVHTDVVGMLDDKGALTLNLAKPTPVAPLVALLPAFSSSLDIDDVNSLNAQGDIAILQLYLSTTQQLANLGIHQLGWQPTKQFPGIQGLDIGVNWNGDSARITVEANDTTLVSHALLQASHDVTRLQASMYMTNKCASAQPNTAMTCWRLYLSEFALEGANIHATLQGAYDVNEQYLSLKTLLGELPQNQASHFFPSALMGRHTSAYLTKALEGDGQITSASLIWSGNVTEFPFSTNTGIFQASVSINGGTFRFADDWPVLRTSNMKLLFENDALLITGPSGSLSEIQLTHIDAQIPSLSADSHVHINALAQARGDSLTALMLNSSMRQSLGKLLSQDIQVTGPLDAKLSLTVPFTGKNVKVGGEARLRGNDVHFPTIDLSLNAAQGVIAFENDRLVAKEMRAQWQGQPIAFDFTGQQQKASYDVEADIQGQTDILQTMQRFQQSWPVSGETDWRLALSMQFASDRFDYSATLTSDLLGFQSDLPFPLDKTVQQQLPLTVLSTGDRQASHVRVTLGDNIRFDGALPHDSMQFSRGHLAIGASELQGMGMGLSISLNLPELDVDAWLGYLRDTNIAAQHGTLLPMPERIFIITENMRAMGQVFNQVDMTLKQQQQAWDISINAQQARGKVAWHVIDDEPHLQVVADYLKLSDNPAALTSENSSEWSIDAVPNLSITCAQCFYNKLDLGQIAATLVRENDKVVLQSLSIAQKHGQLTASGEWYRDPTGADRSVFEGRLTSGDIGALLQQLDLETGIKDSTADMTFNLGWEGTLTHPKVSELNGKVTWSLSDGYLSELSDKGSRIFTIFSLSSLVRKLSLDFRDVFAKGFFYDKMTGTLSVENGVVLTDDTRIDGGAGEMLITGQSNLVNKQLNYNVSFTPNVTGNLPFLVYFLATPQTALAAFAIDRVLTSAKVISNINYRVHGTFDEPVIEEVTRASKEVQLPAKTSPDDVKTDLPADNLQPMSLQIIDG